MFRRELLQVIRVSPADEQGLTFVEGEQKEDAILYGKVISPATGRTYRIKHGYLDLLDHRTGNVNAANLTNLLPGAGRGYEPIWRRHSLNLLTGESFSNERELEKVAELVQLESGGLYLDLGCSSGLYARNLQLRLGGRGDVVGIDISPSMLKEAAQSSGKARARTSFARADAHALPFADGTFDGVVCGGTLNELKYPAHSLREVHRVLKPGGRLAIMGLLKAQKESGARLQGLLKTGGLHFFEEGDVEQLLGSTGFSPAHLEKFGAVFFAGTSRE